MNTRTPKAELRPERPVELVAQPLGTTRHHRSRRQEPQAVSDPTYGCVDWFEYRAADGEEEAAETRRIRH
ncbi:MAG TPA: hypothetical protein VF322_12640 [Gammaproteobacteria bacterium]